MRSWDVNKAISTALGANLIVLKELAHVQATDATPGPGASGKRLVTALYLNDDVDNGDI